jgi:RecA/RadA recombinase
MKETDEIKDALTEKTVEKPSKGLLSSGNTLLNLACSGRPFGAFTRGAFYLVVGDSTSGKTVLAGTCFAEAAINKRFDDYDLIFDNVENGALMFDKFFGEKIASRIKPPAYDEDRQPVYSTTVEEFYYHLHLSMQRAQKKGRSVIYVIDSENALSSDAEKKKQKEKRKSIADDTETAGTMTDSKAQVHSRNLRAACIDLRDTDSILIMISQTRDNMGFGAQFEPKTRAGGRALKFYAMLEMWSSVKGKIKMTVRGKARTVGMLCHVKIKKNRFTGKDRSVTLPIYHSFGFDDIGACIDYLLEEKHWKNEGGEIHAKELRFKGSRGDLITYIEDKNMERDLRVIVGEVWNDIEEACEVHRKSRYI